jgi:hypothetical protein
MDGQLDGITANLTIFNIILMFLGAIHKHGNFFPTIWTLKKIGFHFRN